MKLVTIKEVSKFLSVKESTLYSWVNKGSIPSLKINGLIRFDMEEIDQWVRTPRKTDCKAHVGTKNAIKDQEIESIIKKAIDDVISNRYNPSIGKPGSRQGLRKEVDDGTL